MTIKIIDKQCELIICNANSIKLKIDLMAANKL